MEIHELKINEVYINSDIADAFGCAPQGGMRRSLRTNTLVLISMRTEKNIYGDKWINGQLHYTGMGQRGDQQLNSQNRTLAESNDSDITLHLFEVFDDRKYTYAGTVILAGEPYTEKEADKDGYSRIVYRFPLMIVDETYQIRE